MKTKKSRIMMVFLFIFFSLVVLMSISALSLNAGGRGDPLPEVDGRWKDVCCGSLCSGGIDYCMGTGSYTCCK